MLRGGKFYDCILIRDQQYGSTVQLLGGDRIEKIFWISDQSLGLVLENNIIYVVMKNN